MKVIGITGASGSGKSTFVKLLGLNVINADAIAREVVAKGSQCLLLLCKQFGDDILTPQKELNRKLLAERAFSSQINTEKLNSITHPFIVAKIKEKILLFENQGEKAIILDAPQLFEAHCEDFCDLIVGIIADDKIRLKRIMNRDKIAEDLAKKRLNIGKSDSFFRNNCDIIIENNSDLNNFKKAAEKILKLI